MIPKPAAPAPAHGLAPAHAAVAVETAFVAIEDAAAVAVAVAVAGGCLRTERDEGQRRLGETEEGTGKGGGGNWKALAEAGRCEVAPFVRDPLLESWEMESLRPGE